MNIKNKKKTFLIVVAFFALSPFVFNDSAINASKQKVYIIPVSGNVEPGMAAFIKRSFRDTSDDLNPLFIIEMDTFGGRVDSALQIVDTLLNIPNGKTIAFVVNKAISAGALIALACN